MRFPGFIGPSYTLQSVNVDCQRCVNLFPEINALGTGKEREVAALVPTPGLSLLLTLSGGTTRGGWSASNGQFFAVGGNKLYRISSSWVATELGTLNTSTGSVSMSDNGSQLVIVDGNYGYVWDINASTFNQITDPDFPGADQVAYLNEDFLFNKINSGQFFWSAINDGTSYDALDIATAESSPDNLVGILTLNQSIYLPGTKSTEVYYDSGDATTPYQRIQGSVVDIGCSAPFSIAKAVGTYFFLGGDDTGTGIVYQTQGYQPKRISTPAIEKYIRDLITTGVDISTSTGYTYQQGGHLFYCLNLTSADTTWVYDASTQMWHERQYLNLWSMERHRAEWHALAFGKNVVGDYDNGNIYALDQDTYTDNGTYIRRIRTAPHFSNGLVLVRHNRFQLDMETGVGISGSGQGSNPQAILRYSDDGGHTWSNEKWADVGAIGNYKTRVNWRRLGSSRDRVYEVSVSDPVKVVLIGAELDVEEGSS